MLVVGKEGANAAVEAPLGCVRVRVECCCLLLAPEGINESGDLPIFWPDTAVVREDDAADGDVGSR